MRARMYALADVSSMLYDVFSNLYSQMPYGGTVTAPIGPIFTVETGGAPVAVAAPQISPIIGGAHVTVYPGKEAEAIAKVAEAFMKAMEAQHKSVNPLDMALLGLVLKFMQSTSETPTQKSMAPPMPWWLYTFVPPGTQGVSPATLPPSPAYLPSLPTVPTTRPPEEKKPPSPLEELGKMLAPLKSWLPLIALPLLAGVSTYIITSKLVGGGRR